MRARFYNIPIVNEDQVLHIGTQTDFDFKEYSFVVDFTVTDLPSGNKYFLIMQANICHNGAFIDIRTTALNEFITELIRENYESIDLNFEKVIL
jgi:hypothetical protein